MGEKVKAFLAEGGEVEQNQEIEPYDRVETIVAIEDIPPRTKATVLGFDEKNEQLVIIAIPNSRLPWLSRRVPRRLLRKLSPLVKNYYQEN